MYIMDLSITKGNYFYQRITGLDDAGSAINLSGYSISGFVRQSYGSSGILLNLNPTIVSGNLGVSYPSGLVDITISRTGAFNLPVTYALYSIEIYSGQDYSKVIQNGKFIINPEITY